MQHSKLALAGALCAGLFLFSGACAAQSDPQSSMSPSSMTMTDAQVTAKLQAAGYTNVQHVRREGSHFDAQAMKNGKTMHVHVDARSGAITPATSESEEDEEHEDYQH